LRLAVLTIAGLATGCLVVPASQSTFGIATTATAVRYRAGAGVHLSAFDRRDRHEVDVGAGYIAEYDQTLPTAHGTYLALGRRLAREWWLGGRAEQFWRVDDAALPRRGLVLRLAFRRHLAGASAFSGGGGDAIGVYGAVATGAFVELGGRQLADGGSEVFASIGVALDLPLVFSATTMRGVILR